MTLSSERRERRAGVHEVALRQAGVVSVSQLGALGVSRAAMRAEIAAGRWHRRGTRTLVVAPFAVCAETDWWTAVLETGRVSALDGTSALEHAGLRNFTDDSVHVSVPRFDHRRQQSGVVVHNINKRLDGELDGGCLRCVRPDVATIRAAAWARTDRQAALIMTMAVQQRLLSGETLIAASLWVGVRERREFIRRTALDIGAGSESLGELDFIGLCRQEGLPLPSQQVVRTGSSGRVYLDVRWPCGLVVEIDGVQHHEGMGPVDDALRQNAVTLGSDKVLRVPLLGLRLYPERFIAQVRQGLAVLGAA
ncbi:hypothetical protein [Calidifontibacter indicus]|nr:hypothetical protein [Calidifontibacter indicus]